MSNGRQITRSRARPPAPAQQQMLAPPVPGQHDSSGGWMWDGSQWVCCDNDFDDCRPPFPFPGPQPPQFPPWFDPHNAPWYPGANAGVSFGSTTFPQFPIRGNFFWDGLRLWMFDGAAWVSIVDSAIHAGPPPGTPGVPGTPGTPGAASSVFIGTQPPPNPVPGVQWWNGSILQMWDGSTWKPIGPGQAAGPVPSTTSVFTMTATTGRPLNASGWTIVPFIDSPGVDPMSGWDSIQHKFTPNKAGVYLFEIRGYPVGIALLKNDPGTFTNAPLSSDIIIGISSQAGGGWQQATGLSLMNGAGDFVRMWGTATSFPATGANPCFTATLLP